MRYFAVLLAAFALNSAALAQAPLPAVTEAQPAQDVLDSLPADLLGAPAVRTSGIVTYFGERFGRDPMIGVTAVRIDSQSSPEQMREGARDAFHESSIRRVLREGTFTAPNWPNATAFFGEYLTGTGLKQSWTLESNGRRLHVLSTLFRMEDRERVEREVATRIFGGAVISAQGEQP